MIKPPSHTPPLSSPVSRPPSPVETNPKSILKRRNAQVSLPSTKRVFFAEGTFFEVKPRPKPVFPRNSEHSFLPYYLEATNSREFLVSELPAGVLPNEVVSISFNSRKIDLLDDDSILPFQQHLCSFSSVCDINFPCLSNTASEDLQIPHQVEFLFLGSLITASICFSSDSQCKKIRLASLNPQRLLVIPPVTTAVSIDTLSGTLRFEEGSQCSSLLINELTASGDVAFPPSLNVLRINCLSKSLDLAGFSHITHIEVKKVEEGCILRLPSSIEKHVD